MIDWTTRRRYVFPFLGGLMLCSATVVAQAPVTKIAYDEALQTRRSVAEYSNPWFRDDPTGNDVEPVSTAFFGGGVSCEPPGCPTDGAIQLAAVSFGQPFANDIPFTTRPGCTPGTDCTYVEHALHGARAMLYYSSADPTVPLDQDDPGTGLYSPSAAAFRYKELLYSRVAGDPVNQIEARLKSMADFYSTAERNRSLEAERRLRDVLKHVPTDGALRHALLDLYYDRAVAELALAKEKLVTVARQRIEPPPPGGFVIQNEISLYEEILGDPGVPGGYRYALQGYFELLRDPMGVDVSAVDPSVSDGRPYGYYIFQQDVPARSQYAATFREGDITKDVLTGVELTEGDLPSQLFAGFKDLSMLFDVLGNYGAAAADLARLYSMRGTRTVVAEADCQTPAGEGDDICRALKLISEGQQKLYLEGNLLLDAFDPASLPAPGDPSALAEKIAWWRHGMAELQRTREFILGDANILGFSEDFLMLVQETSVGADPFSASSYDQLIAWMQATPTAPLAWARTKYDEARLSYDTYQGTRDQLATQYLDRQNNYTLRLFKIVGANPGEPGYETPELNAGSEIWQQLNSIGVARTRILLNNTRMTNLIDQIQIEIDRRGEEQGIQNAISQVYIRYGNEHGRITEQISQIQAAQAYLNSTAAAASSAFSLNIAGAVSHSVNAVLHAAAELAKGKLQAKKENLAAEERASINDLNSEILDANSEAQIKTWWLQTRTLDVENYELILLLTQEVGRLTALVDEKAELERRMALENELLADRYFADPVHLLRMQSDMIEAEEAFQEAQKWVFFAARALEYKYNAPIDHAHGGRAWNLGSLYRLRNAEELQAMIAALEDFDTSLSSTTRDDYFDWFSVREDFLGYRYLVDGQVQLYEDPETGELLNAIEAFRRELNRRIDGSGFITLDFSTVRQVPGGAFFRGPTYAGDGTLLNAGLWLDKIQWIKISLPGQHSLGRSLLTGFLRYGGTSFVRTQDVGTVDPARPDFVEGEMTAWPSRYWYYHIASDSWRSSEGLNAPVEMQLTADPDVPPTVQQIDVFRERSVATTGWRLVIPTEDLGATVLNIDELNDIKLYFYHWAAIRPSAKTRTDADVTADR